MLQVLNERAVKDTELLNSRLTKLQQDFDAQLSSAEQLAQENNQKAAELRVILFLISLVGYRSDDRVIQKL